MSSRACIGVPHQTTHVASLIEMAAAPSNNRALLAAYPQNVGILGMDVYFPRQYVAQADLEKFDNVSAGKYTIGLGQQHLAFIEDREDVYSMALTVVARLMRETGTRYDQIGRLEVATETIMDHSKSVKTVLMQLFADSGNTDVEGVDTLNACYAGTNALFNSTAWIESSAWDGRLALVVTADIAEYAKGAARPTGGAAALAMLIGPNASIVLEPGMRASHMAHSYDFFKPHLSSPYPVVDGKGSAMCYLRSLDLCYQRLCEKRKNLLGADTAVESFDHVVCHAPYNKLVQKSFGRLLYNDYVRAPAGDARFVTVPETLRDVLREASYEDAALEKAFVGLSKAAYAKMVQPGTLIPVMIGNVYTCSMFAGLLSLVVTQGGALRGKSVLAFAYGSGLASSIYTFRVRDDDAAVVALERIKSCARVEERLAARTACEPAAFDAMMQKREKLHHSDAGFEPTDAIDTLFPGTFYLVRKDDSGRRTYAQTPLQ